MRYRREQTENNKMLHFNPNISIMALNINGLKTQLKERL